MKKQFKSESKRLLDLMINSIYTNNDIFLRELISNGESSLKIRDEALKEGYRPLVVDAVNKVVNGVTTLDEINKKLALF